MATSDFVGLSYWHDSLPAPIVPRASLPGDTEADVAIVGAGFTGLWTAYYLSRADPSVRVAIVEKEVAGFGASGRNGGWCIGEFAADSRLVEKRSSRNDAINFVRALHDTVDEVGIVAEREGIDCHYHKGGVVYAATSRPQLERVRARIAVHRSYGFGEDDYRELSPREAVEILNARGLHGGGFSPHTAALHPARLARGLGDVVERAGVRLYERTAATRIEPGAVATSHGRIRAPVVVRALEGYTVDLSGHEGAILPLGNHVIATEPLPAETWEQIGLANRPAFADGRHLLGYGQRTADGRLVFGGMAVPYRWRSRTGPDPVAPSPAHRRLERWLRDRLPALSDVRITHRWGGVFGAPRDWLPSVGIDRASGFAWAGGYVGEGVAASNLAGRTLCDLILERDSELTRHPWVGHRSPPWEPEPWRWLGVHGGEALFRGVDWIEGVTGRHQRWASRLR